MSNQIKDVLQDLVSFVVPMNFTAIKVTGTDDSTVFQGTRTEPSALLMKATVKKPVEDFVGTFGMGNLRILKGYTETFLSLERANDKNKLSISVKNKENTDIPSDIIFSIPGAANAVYRLMTEAAALPKQAVPKAEFTWDVEVVQPSKAKIQEFNSFASILSDVDKHFYVKTVDNTLKFYIGEENAATSKVNFVFADDVSSVINTPLFWNSSDFLSIMSLASSGNTTVKFSNQGMIKILVDTGIINYEFLLPGSKP